MSLAFLTSWRAALLAAGLVTLTVAGWNLAFGPDAETRLAERRIAQMFPSGEASSDILDRAIAAGIPYTDFGITLREIVALFPDAIVTYEPLSTTAFVARLSMINNLTLEPLEFAFRFVVADGPEGYGAMARFTERSLVLDHTAVNRVEVNVGDGAELMYNIRSQVLAARTMVR